VCCSAHRGDLQLTRGESAYVRQQNSNASSASANPSPVPWRTANALFSARDPGSSVRESSTSPGPASQIDSGRPGHRLNPQSPKSRRQSRPLLRCVVVPSSGTAIRFGNPPQLESYVRHVRAPAGRRRHTAESPSLPQTLRPFRRARPLFQKPPMKWCRDQGAAVDNLARWRSQIIARTTMQVGQAVFPSDLPRPTTFVDAVADVPFVEAPRTSKIPP